MLGTVQVGDDCAVALVVPGGMIFSLDGRTSWKSGVDGWLQYVCQGPWAAWRAARPKEAPPASRIVTQGDVIGGHRRSGIFVDQTIDAA
jgi:hypothetical protein